MSDLKFPFKFKINNFNTVYIVHEPINNHCIVGWQGKEGPPRSTTFTLDEVKSNIEQGWWTILEDKPEQETYTDQELGYIAELEDRVAYLEDLCSDYVKIINRNDLVIGVQGVTPNAYEKRYGGY